MTDWTGLGTFMAANEGVCLKIPSVMLRFSVVIGKLGGCKASVFYVNLRTTVED